jgi:hypothetical protein
MSSARIIDSTAASLEPWIGAPHIGQAFDTPARGVGRRQLRIAMNLECAVIVVRQQRHGEQRLAVLAKIRRHIADVQSFRAGMAFRLPPTPPLPTRPAHVPSPIARLPAESRRRRIQDGNKANTANCCAAANPAAPIHRAAKSGNRRIHAPGVLQHIAQIIVRGG